MQPIITNYYPAWILSSSGTAMGYLPMPNEVHMKFGRLGKLMTTPARAKMVAIVVARK